MPATGWKTPNEVYEEYGFATTMWGGFADAKTDNGVYCGNGMEKGGASHYLRLIIYNFTDADIPAGSTINGIEVEIQRKASVADSIVDFSVYLWRQMARVGDNKASAEKWPIVEAPKVYGGTADKWGLGTALTESYVKECGFGVELVITNSNMESAVTALVDVVRIRVYYTPPATTITTVPPSEAIEESTFVITAAFTDEEGDAVAPTAATWTLSDKQGTIINSREDVAISDPTAIENIVLSGDDLAFQDGERKTAKRVLTVEWTYDSDLGTGLPGKDKYEFKVTDLVVVT